MTTVQGLPKKFDQKKILKVIKKKFGTFPSRSTGFLDRLLAPQWKLQPLCPQKNHQLTVCVTACNGTIVNDTEMGDVIQLQGDQRKDVQEFLTDKKEGLELDAKTIKVHGF